MTNTDTADIDATVRQVRALARAGSELVRVTVNTDEAAAAVPAIVERLARTASPCRSWATFTSTDTSCCASSQAARRHWPSTDQSGQRRPRQQARPAVRGDDRDRLPHGKPVRIGVNWGSLDQDLLTRMMDENSVAPTASMRATSCARRSSSRRSTARRAPRSSACRTTTS
jgi:(E)-4-hydroxy-3-methylbut-2-enyl-diphosphate synthase